jgi:hypothetical protein
VQKTSGHQVISQIIGFLQREDYIAVTRHVYKGIIENLGTARFHNSLFGMYAGAQFIVAKLNEVRQGGIEVGVPVSAAIVFQQPDFIGLRPLLKTKTQQGKAQYKTSSLKKMHNES